MQAEPKLQTYLRVTILVSICGAAEKSSLNWLDSAPKSYFPYKREYFSLFPIFIVKKLTLFEKHSSAVPKQVLSDYLQSPRLSYIAGLCQL